MYRWEAIHIFIIAYVAYALMMFSPRDSQHKVVTAFLVIYMWGQHISSMWRDYGGWRMEVTAHTMLEVTKIWGLTWSFRDGFLT